MCEKETVRPLFAFLPVNIHLRPLMPCKSARENRRRQSPVPSPQRALARARPRARASPHLTTRERQRHINTHHPSLASHASSLASHAVHARAHRASDNPHRRIIATHVLSMTSALDAARPVVGCAAVVILRNLAVKSFAANALSLPTFIAACVLANIVGVRRRV